MKLVYLMGMPFSGTTLLSRIVSMHPEIASIGEMVNVINMVDRGSYLCSCGERLSECQFWLGVKTKMGHEGHDFDLMDFTIKPPKRIAGIIYRGGRLVSDNPSAFGYFKAIARAFSVCLADSSLTHRMRAFSKCVLEQSDKSIFFDASKDPNLLFYLVGCKHFQPVFVHMVRDPRGVSVSMMKNLSRSSFESCVTEWVSTNRKIAFLLSLFPEFKTVAIRYEDLCYSPSQVIERLCLSIGASNWSPSSYDARDTHIIGNRMRLSALNSIKIDEKWLEVLSDRDIEIARKVAGPLAERFGYSL